VTGLDDEMTLVMTGMTGVVHTVGLFNAGSAGIEKKIMC
jgi:hypothetical protein